MHTVQPGPVTSGSLHSVTGSESVSMTAPPQADAYAAGRWV